MRSQTGKHTLCERSQSKATWTCQKSHYVWKFKGKLPGPNPGTPVLCEPAQSQRTWTFHNRFHKSHFGWTFTGKVLDPDSRTPILIGNLQDKKHTDSAEEPFCAVIDRKDAAHPFRARQFVSKFTGKTAHGDVTRAILCGNLL